MKRRGVVIMSLVFGVSLAVGPPGGVLAAEQPKKQLCPICSKLEHPPANYAEKAGNTLARGLLNFGLGWTEMIRQPGKNARKGGPVLNGFVNGVSFGARRTIRGLGEILTFWTPKMGDEYIHFSKDCPLDTMQ